MELAGHPAPPARATRRGFLFPLLLALTAWFGWPVIEHALELPVYTYRLLRMPAPEHVAVPVKGVRPANLRDSWGGARSGGRRHEGIDIFARVDTPVIASTEGIVTRVGTNSLGGKVVWVMGPGGQRHYYAHLNAYANIRAGQRIDVGTVLGFVGNTGNARGTPHHLHYGIYTSKGAVNPYPLLVPK